MGSISNSKLRIAIVGGGIGGLTCAAALKDCHHKVEIDLFEAAAQFTEIGAGIIFWPRTWSVLKALGVEDEVIEAFRADPSAQQQGPVWSFRKSDQKEGAPIHQLYIDASGTYLHRQQILDLLLQQLPPSCRVHFGHRLSYCEESEDSVQLHFLNGVVSGPFDIVIGADGIKSVVRETVTGLNGAGSILYTGQTAFRGLVPKETLAATHPNHSALHAPTMYLGKSKHVVTYPIRNGKIVNIVAFFATGCSTNTSDAHSPPTDEALATYPGWEEELIELLKMVENYTISPIKDLAPLKTFVTRRVALLGDAAHAMAPHLGAGACTAIEDAYILGTIISRSSCTPDDVHCALDIYNAIRQPYGNNIMRWAHEMGDYYEFDTLEFAQSDMSKGVSPEQLSVFVEALGKYWTWPTRADGAVEGDLKHALSMLQDAGLSEDH